MYTNHSYLEDLQNKNVVDRKTDIESVKPQQLTCWLKFYGGLSVAQTNQTLQIFTL